MTKTRTPAKGHESAPVPTDGTSVDQAEGARAAGAKRAVQYSAEQIRSLRQRLGVSQTSFAQHLGTTKGVVTQWEQGLRIPGRTTQKLLWVVDRHGLKVLT